MWNQRDHPHDQSIGANLFEGCRLTAIYDRKVIMRVGARDIRIKRPVILGPNAFEEATKDNQSYRLMTVIGHVLRRPVEVQNAGHTAIVWALRCGHDPVHLWGFDSLWTNKRTTATDEVFPATAGPEAPKPWNKSWREIFDAHPKAVFPVHAPEGATLCMKDLNRHFRLVHEPSPQPA